MTILSSIRLRRDELTSYKKKLDKEIANQIPDERRRTEVQSAFAPHDAFLEEVAQEVELLQDIKKDSTDGQCYIERANKMFYDVQKRAVSSLDECRKKVIHRVKSKEDKRSDDEGLQMKEMKAGAVYNISGGSVGGKKSENVSVETYDNDQYLKDVEDVLKKRKTLWEKVCDFFAYVWGLLVNLWEEFVSFLKELAAFVRDFIFGCPPDDNKPQKQHCQ